MKMLFTTFQQINRNSYPTKTKLFTIWYDFVVFYEFDRCYVQDDVLPAQSLKHTQELSTFRTFKKALVI